MQAPMFDGFLFNPFALFYDGFSSSEVGISGRDVVEVFVIALMVVMLDERVDLRFEVAWQEVVFQQDAVLERLVPAFDLTLCLRMHTRAGNGVLFGGSYTDTAGNGREVIAVAFTTDQVNTRYLLPEGFAYDPDVFTLPNLRGYVDDNEFSEMKRAA